MISFARPRYVLLAICLVIVLAIVTRRRTSLISAVAVIILGLAPFVWFSLASNHSIIHYHFTFRLLSVTLFALLVLVVYVIDWQRTARTVKRLLTSKKQGKREMLSE